MCCPVSSLELRQKKESNGVLNQVCAYHEKVYAYNVVNKVWFVRSVCSQHSSKFITSITSESVSQIRTKKCKTRSFLFKVNLNFLTFCLLLDTLYVIQIFAVIVSFLKEGVHGFNNIGNGSVKTRFEIVEF